jgi:hypothetical protein
MGFLSLSGKGPCTDEAAEAQGASSHLFMESGRARNVRGI